jgi:hypothetical protein
MPGRPAFEDRQVAGREIAFHSDLVAKMRRDTLVAPAAHSGHIQFRQTCLRHPDSLPARDPSTLQFANGVPRKKRTGLTSSVDEGWE